MIKKLKFLIIIFIALLLIAGAAYYVSYRQNLPQEQILADAFVTITAPQLNKDSVHEKYLSVALSGKIKTAAFYQAVQGKVQYLVRFNEFAETCVLESGVKSIENLLKNDNFVYTAVENKVDDMEGILLNGTFQRNGKEFGLKQQFVKEGNYFWQILVIFPTSKSNEKRADNFIKSIKISPPKP